MPEIAMRPWRQSGELQSSWGNVLLSRASTGTMVVSPDPAAIEYGQTPGVSVPALQLHDRLAETVADFLRAFVLRSNKDWWRGAFSGAEIGATARHEPGAALERMLRDIFAEEPVEDGLSHPAERLLAATLVGRPTEAQRWLAGIVSGGGGSPSLRSPLMSCVGRLPRAIVLPWGYELAAAALRDQDVAVRDAAVGALEIWADARALAILSAHSEPEPWLRDYAARVVRDLSVPNG